MSYYRQRKEFSTKHITDSKLKKTILADSDEVIIRAELEYAKYQAGISYQSYIAQYKYLSYIIREVGAPVPEIRNIKDKEGNEITIDMEEDKRLKCYEIKEKCRKAIPETVESLKKLEIDLAPTVELREKIIKSLDKEEKTLTGEDNVVEQFAESGSVM